MVVGLRLSAMARPRLHSPDREVWGKDTHDVHAPVLRCLLRTSDHTDEPDSRTLLTPLEQVPVPRPSTTKKTNGQPAKKNGSQPDLKATLWSAADKMRGNMDLNTPHR